MPEAFVVGGVRTPIGRYGGTLSQVRPDDLAALVIAELVARVGVEPSAIDDIVFGDANQAGEDDRNVARTAALMAGLPVSVPGITVNRLCASGLSAVHIASAMVESGEAELVIAGGVECMSRAPWVLAKPEKAFSRPGEIVDTSIGWRFTNPRFAERDKWTFSMPETAEEVGVQEGITRDEADAFALRSHRRALAAAAAAAAAAEGRFADEIVTVTTPRGPVAADEGPRADSSIEVLGSLRPLIRGGSLVTAGNASPLNDGAAAVLIASEATVTKLGLEPRVRILGGSSAGVSPEVMGLGPIPPTAASPRCASASRWPLSERDE